MSILEIFIIALGLSMDALAVAIGLGLGMAAITLKKAVIVGLYFGLFQAGMPVAGYIIAAQFSGHITRFSYPIAFGLLFFLGAKMIWGAVRKNAPADTQHPEPKREKPLKPTLMLPLAVATSIDAMAVGVSFALLEVGIALAILLIGVVTFAVSALGVKIGNIFGNRFESRAEIAGGIILIAMGVWVLLG